MATLKKKETKEVKKTKLDLLKRALIAIKREEKWIHAVALNRGGQVLSTAKDKPWFMFQVMLRLTKMYEGYAHLRPLYDYLEDDNMPQMRDE